MLGAMRTSLSEHISTVENNLLLILSPVTEAGAYMVHRNAICRLPADDDFTFMGNLRLPSG